LSGCYALRSSHGGGQTEFTLPRVIDARDVLVPAGYRIEAVATGLTFPTGIAFDTQGRPHVVEAGYSYGEAFATPRLLRIESDGRTSVIATGDDYVPWTGITYHDGAFYVAANGQREGTPTGGRILRITSDGRIAVVVDGLPGRGDHHTNGPVIGPDGWLYFAQGTATNSGVVGPDNAEMGWLRRFPDFHDIPCADITLAGENYTSENPLAGRGKDTAVTGAFVPFGTLTEPGQIIPGRVPCSGAVMRVRPEGGPIELVAWGFRNPFGLAFAPDGRLFLTENSYDERGSRPVFGTGDHLWEIRRGIWYGWPDFHGDKPLTDANRFKSSRGEPLRFVMANHPDNPPRPVAVFGVHASANGFDFSRNSAFGQVGHAFVAQLGDQAPMVGKVMAPVGFKVVTVDVTTGVVHDFAANAGSVNGPASWAKNGGLERPVAARFDPAGNALYIVDFGVMTADEKGLHPQPQTGVLWRITRVPDTAP